MKRIQTVAMVAAFLLGASAVAEEADAPFSKVGMSAMVGGGVTSFINSGATDVTRPGGTWTARLLVGTRSRLGVEAAYIGSAQAIDAIGLDNRAFLVSNGIEGNVRFNVLTGSWQPYAIAGVAWRHYTLQNTASNTSSVSSTDDAAEIPLGVGLTWRYQRLMVDGRVSLNSALETSLIPSTNLSNVNVGLRLGFEF